MVSSKAWLWLVSLLLVLSWWAPAAIAAEDAAGLPIMDEAGVGTVSLHNVPLEKADSACLTGLVQKLVSAADNHQISYLKMLIFADDSVVTDMLAGPHLVIKRDAPHNNALIVPLNQGAGYFLTRTGQSFYTQGVMPENFVFSKCLK
jgi:hypothetical protein